MSPVTQMLRQDVSQYSQQMYILAKEVNIVSIFLVGGLVIGHANHLLLLVMVMTVTRVIIRAG